MSQRDLLIEAANVESLPCLTSDDAGPVFAEPWQAMAFALAVYLSEQGYFSWKEWAAVFAEELRVDAEGGEPDDGSRYYHCWLAALERIVVARRLSDVEALLAGKEAWADAYRRTPHGRPVQLEGEYS